MPGSSFTRGFLLIFAGPIVWAMHFVFIYGLAGVLCARPAWNFPWLGMHAAEWGTLAASLVAFLLLVVIFASARLPDAADDNRSFVRWLSVTLAILSVLAIAWETLPVFLLSACR